MDAKLQAQQLLSEDALPLGLAVPEFVFNPEAAEFIPKRLLHLDFLIPPTASSADTQLSTLFNYLMHEPDDNCGDPVPPDNFAQTSKTNKHTAQDETKQYEYRDDEYGDAEIHAGDADKTKISPPQVSAPDVARNDIDRSKALSADGLDSAMQACHLLIESCLQISKAGSADVLDNEDVPIPVQVEFDEFPAQFHDLCVRLCGLRMKTYKICLEDLFVRAIEEEEAHMPPDEALDDYEYEDECEEMEQWLLERGHLDQEDGR